MADPTVLVTVRLPRKATLTAAMDRLGLDNDEVDTGYGLVPIDPDKGLYVLRVTPAAGRRVSRSSAEASGPYSDPRIEPYGPPS